MAAEMKKKAIIKGVLVYVITILVLLFVMFLSVWIGNSNYSVSFGEMIAGIFTGNNTYVNMFMDIRGPRTIVAVLCGMCLAVSGVLLQSVTRNQLADASIIGVSTSTYLGNLVCTLTLSGTALIFSPLIAFVFGMVVFSGVLYLSWSHGIRSNRILLVGIAFNTVLMLVNLTIILMQGTAATAMLMSFVGSLSIPSTEEIISVAVFTGIGLAAAIIVIPKCNVLALGDKTATGLGTNVNAVKAVLVVISVFLCAVATKMIGITSFIGLLAPICARKLLGKNYKHVIPLSALFGGLFVLLGDFVGRCIITEPFSLPVGIVTSLIGGVVFIVLLKRSFGNGSQKS